MDDKRRSAFPYFAGSGLIVDLFDTNARLLADLTKKIAKICPGAFILVITNPVNSLTPLVAQVLRSENKFNPNKLFGITAVDVVRASTFAAKVTGMAPEEISVPVVGGHSLHTIVPLVSQSSPALNLSLEQQTELIQKVQRGGGMKSKRPRPGPEQRLYAWVMHLTSNGPFSLN